MNQQAYIEDLLQKIDSGEATEEACAAIMQLLRNDPSGEVAQWVTHFLQLPDVLPGEELSHDFVYWDKLAERILQADKRPEQDDYDLSEPPTPVRRLPFHRYSRWWVAAAVVFLLAGSCWLFLHFRQKTIFSATTIATLNVVPGHAGAILTLADGKQVVLDRVGNGNIAMQGSTRITQKDGLLAYEPSSGSSGPDIRNSTNSPVLYNTMTTPRGRQFQLLLPDGTKVWLNAASSIRYPTVFMGNIRQVSVTGEAYFEVTPQSASLSPKGKQDRVPFIVKIHTPSGDGDRGYDGPQVTVLGTHFDIMAYSDEPEMHTTLLEGAVKFSNGKSQAFLKPGEKGSTTHQANAGITVKETNTDEATAWVRGQLVMGDADMEKLAREISRWYDVDIIFEGPIPQRHFWSIINRNINLSDVLQVLNANGVRTRKEGNKIIISAK